MGRTFKMSPPDCRQTPREAILWLLEKVPHSEEEIAEHFGLPVQAVTKITGVLLAEGKIVRFGRNKKMFLPSRRQR